MQLTAEMLSLRVERCIATIAALRAEREPIEHAAAAIANALRGGNKLVVLGNGGSAADAQHIVAELVGRYLKDRPALAAIALTVNTSSLTAIANDYGYARVFARQLEGLGNRGDVCLALSTSGNSENVLLAIETARAKGMMVIGMTGRNGGRVRGVADICISAPSDETPRIQEAHIFIGHLLCELVETWLSQHPESP